MRPMAAVAQAISLRGIGKCRPRHPAPARLGRRRAVGRALTLLLGRHVVRHAALQFGVGVGGGRGHRQSVVGAGVLLREWYLLRERRRPGLGVCDAWVFSPMQLKLIAAVYG